MAAPRQCSFFVLSMRAGSQFLNTQRCSFVGSVFLQLVGVDTDASSRLKVGFDGGASSINRTLAVWPLS